MRNPIRFLALAAGLTTLGLAARPALAAGFDGQWTADIPAEGRCNYTGFMTVTVAGDALMGQTHNPPSSGVRVAHITGHLDADGNATFFVKEGGLSGTMKFQGDHFDATWSNGVCDRHAEGDRAPDPAQQAAMAAERRQHQDRYADLVRRANADDRTLDYTLLRTESVYGDKWSFYDTEVNGLLSQADALVKGKDCVAGLEKLDEVLKRDFIIDQAHKLKADCLRQTGLGDQARIESDIADALTHSLMDSSAGTHTLVRAITGAAGATEDAAYVVTTYREEMEILQKREIQLKYRQTEIRGGNGRFYDLIKGVSIQTGFRVDVTLKDVYFDVSSFVAGQASRRAMAATTVAAAQ